jgi:hypothetical protein
VPPHIGPVRDPHLIPQLIDVPAKRGCIRIILAAEANFRFRFLTTNLEILSYCNVATVQCKPVRVANSISTRTVDVDTGVIGKFGYNGSFSAPIETRFPS